MAAFPDGYRAYKSFMVRKEPGNRIDQMYQQGLLEVGGTVTPSDVAQARQLP